MFLSRYKRKINNYRSIDVESKYIFLIDILYVKLFLIIFFREREKKRIYENISKQILHLKFPCLFSFKNALQMLIFIL